MPFKNIFIPEENLLLNIFYGVITGFDIRDHVMELARQTVLTEGYAKITDGTYIRGADISDSNISSTVSFKNDSTLTQSNGSVMISPSKEVDILAQRFVDEGKRHGEKGKIERTLFDALQWYDKTHLHDELAAEIKKYENFSESKSKVN